ncbi:MULTISPECIES: hypothetical protein [unclassified Polaromonas]|uniref:hypothetical protein n=1 Tax=unclassified Polaromonas TaxID=2638319 RepID=UPI0018CB14AF|nr:MULTISPECIES: hypothetical protein [unclassified Polaromonas]MBG6073096.1 hypothetical protein [Polaromonas sp. CG_9.7]MBG6115101.1 hypothetical protein [Polaromonas sp. CG_9.2]MDH6184929.1 hypothetical protein [Polaromonas sp. CG_23.6]
MKSKAAALLLLLVGGFASLQIGLVKAQTVDINAQRATIAAERNRLEASFLTEDSACYKKFAVNSCLENVNARRDVAMANLRRQEILLNDAQRKNIAEQQIRKNQEKLSPESLQQNGERQNKAIEDFRDRQGRDQESAQWRNAAVANESAARDANAARIENHKKKIQIRAERQADAVEDAKKFRERQIRAQERRVQHDTDEAKRLKPALRSLPLPQ